MEKRFLPSSVDAKFSAFKMEVPQLNFGENLSYRNFTPLKPDWIEARIQKQVSRLPRLNDEYIAEQARPWSPEKRAAFEDRRIRYEQRMQNEALNYLRKQHKKKDDVALAGVRGTIAQLIKDSKGFF